MVGFENSDDSSGNLAAGEPTVPDFTVDGSRAPVVDPDDTQQDPMAARRSQQNQNVTNDPSRTQEELSQQNADTMDDPFGAARERKVWPDPLAPDDTMEDPLAAGKGSKKVWPDPLAPDDTSVDAHGSGRKIYPDPLAPDVTQPEFGSAQNRQAAPSSTNWDPVNGSAPTPPPTQPKKKSGQGFSEGDLFARKYEIKGHIGQGGMGIVYKALDLVLGRPVAIKFLKGKSGISNIEMSRFQQEAKAIASLNHSNIIQVYDMSVTDEGDPYFILEYIEGHALSHEIRGKKQLPLERALDIISQVCDALQHAHEHGVIHRDIKPSNLMIVPRPNGTEVVKLLDFGIAKLNAVDEQTLLKLTKTGELFGSPHYMSPEQCSGQSIEATTDIYSLGCVLYELICGVPPFSGTNAIETLDKHKNASLTSVSSIRKDLPEAKLIDALLDKMMAKEPVDRYQTPAEVNDAVREILRKLKGSPLRRIVKTAFPSGLKDARGKRSAAILITCIVVAGGVAFATVQLSSSHNQVVPKAVPLTRKLQPWKTYDLKGQQLFDKGAYRAAEKQFLTALEKAKSESGKNRELHLYLSLQELRMLYTAMGDKKGMDSIDGELIEIVEPKPAAKPQYSWNDILKKVNSASTVAEFDEFVILAAEMVNNGGSDDSSHDRRAILQLMEKKGRFVGATLASEQSILLDAYIAKKEGLSISKKASAAVFQISKCRPEDLSSGIRHVLINLGLSERDPTVVEKFAEYQSRYCETPDYKQVALICLSEIYHLTGRKYAAIEPIEECLLDLEKQVPRNYWLLLSALKTRGDRYSEEGNYSAAIPLFVRAISISESISTFLKIRNVPTSDKLRATLANAYTGALKYDEAEKILTALVQSNENSSPSFRAELFYKLGIVYMVKRRFDNAESALSKAIEIFAANPSDNQVVGAQYQKAISNLKLVREQRRSEQIVN